MRTRGFLKRLEWGILGVLVIWRLAGSSLLGAPQDAPHVAVGSDPQAAGSHGDGKAEAACAKAPVLERIALHRVRDGALRRAAREVGDLLREGRSREAFEKLTAVPRDGLDASDMSFLARLISLVDSVERFESSLQEDARRDPERVSGVRVALTGAREGTVRGMTTGGLDVELAEGHEIIPLAGLVPASQISLARRYRPRTERALWGAAFSLVHGLHSSFDLLLRAAAAEGNLKGAIDSLLAFDRDLHPVPRGGFVLQDGRWMTAAQSRQEARRTVLQSVLANLRSSSPVARAEARVELHQRLDEDRDSLIEALRRRHRALLARVEESRVWSALQTAFEKREEVERRRRHALELIFDTERYFYPFRPPACPAKKASLYPAVQHEVEQRIRALREVWGREREEAKVLVRLTASFRADVESLLFMRATIDDLELARHIPASRTERRVVWLPKQRDDVTVRNLALSDQERKRLDHDLEVREINGQRRREVPRATWGELAITNAYRQMLGRRMLILEPVLYQSARSHGQWMSRTGKFTHIADDDVGRTPFERMKRAGWTGLGGGENIAYNAGSPEAAHSLWLQSSGHHRNILWATHTHMGAAQVGRYWIQNFGGTSPYQGNLNGDGEGLFD